MKKKLATVMAATMVASSLVPVMQMQLANH